MTRIEGPSGGIQFPQDPGLKKVQDGETLQNLSQRLGISAEDIVKNNDLKLLSGQELRIPRAASGVSDRPDTLERYSSPDKESYAAGTERQFQGGGFQFGGNLNAFDPASSNLNEFINDFAPVETEPFADVAYTTSPGETIRSVADKVGAPVENLLSLNDFVLAEQEILID